MKKRREKGLEIRKEQVWRSNLLLTEKKLELRVESSCKDNSTYLVSKEVEVLLEGFTLPALQKNKRKLCTINHPSCLLRKLRTRSSVAAEAF